ncbi:unnamed protein product, partial [Chrysoparadoxa australica]
SNQQKAVEPVAAARRRSMLSMDGSVLFLLQRPQTEGTIGRIRSQRSGPRRGMGHLYPRTRGVSASGENGLRGGKATQSQGSGLPYEREIGNSGSSKGDGTSSYPEWATETTQTDWLSVSAQSETDAFEPDPELLARTSVHSVLSNLGQNKSMSLAGTQEAKAMDVHWQRGRPKEEELHSLSGKMGWDWRPRTSGSRGMVMELKVLASVEHREQLLVTLHGIIKLLDDHYAAVHELLKQVKTARLSSYDTEYEERQEQSARQLLEKIWTRCNEAKVVVAQLRAVSIETVAGICEWRESFAAESESGHPLPEFIWRRRNYLYKMETDLDSLDEQPLLVKWLGCRATGNPFLVPPAPQGTGYGCSRATKVIHQSPDWCSRILTSLNCADRKFISRLPPRLLRLCEKALRVLKGERERVEAAEKAEEELWETCDRTRAMTDSRSWDALLDMGAAPSGLPGKLSERIQSTKGVRSLPSVCPPRPIYRPKSSPATFAVKSGQRSIRGNILCISREVEGLHENVNSAVRESSAAAALLLQARFRGHFVRLARAKLEVKKAEAALTLQRAWRGHIGRECANLRQTEQRLEGMKVKQEAKRMAGAMGTVRRFLRNIVYLRKVQMKHSAARARLQAELERKHYKAALTIQCATR